VGSTSQPFDCVRRFLSNHCACDGLPPDYASVCDQLFLCYLNPQRFAELSDAMRSGTSRTMAEAQDAREPAHGPHTRVKFYAGQAL